ncbi:MAG: hypothetical protein WC496_10580 [Phycisphaerae bacterium]|jgi:hypothetical protein
MAKTPEMILQLVRFSGGRSQLEGLNSSLWFQDLDDVIRNPYDYENQRLFIKEATWILNKIYSLYDKYQLKFHMDDISLKKCVWMLQIDALDTLRDCIFLIEQNKHRIVGKMFRDIVETLDFAYLIRKDTKKHLNKWFNGKEIKHAEYRNYVKKIKGVKKKKEADKLYHELSNFTHHTYYALKNSYSLGGDNMMVYDSHAPDMLVLPETISQYLWMISFLIKKFIKEMEDSKIFNDGEFITHGGE